MATDERIPTVEYDSFTKAYIWKNVPKKLIVELVRNFTTHPWNLNFQPVALADYISNDDGALECWDVAIPQGSQTENTVPVDLIDRTIDIVPEGRRTRMGNCIYCQFTSCQWTSRKSWYWWMF